MTRSSEWKEGSHEHCTIGAFEVVQRENQLRNMDATAVTTASNIAQQILMVTQEIESIPAWNDAKARTEDDVHEAFRQSQKFIDNLE
jgi:hypothetical protein